MSWYASCCGAAAECEEESRGGALPRLQCFVSEERTIYQALCAPRPLRVVQRAYPVGRDPCVPPFCSCHSEFVGADDSARPHALARESVPHKRGADCRVASLLAMTARRCRADGTSGRRPLRVVQRTYPVGRDPCVPPFCSCHSEFVGADDFVRPHALLAMTDFFRQSQRRGFAPPLLFCRSEQQKMQFMQEHPA